MGPSWMGWVGFIVLAALISVTSCQLLDPPQTGGQETSK